VAAANGEWGCAAVRNVATAGGQRAKSREPDKESGQCVGGTDCGAAICGIWPA